MLVLGLLFGRGDILTTMVCLARHPSQAAKRILHFRVLARISRVLTGRQGWIWHAAHCSVDGGKDTRRRRQRLILGRLHISIMTLGLLFVVHCRHDVVSGVGSVDDILKSALALLWSGMRRICEPRL
jgi:hypothetical protein